jgi:hypothetical protein
VPQAARRGNAPLVEALLSAGARVDTEDAAGLTAVDHAVLCRASHPDSGEPGGGAGAAVLRLLAHSAGERRLNEHRTEAGDTALTLAVSEGESLLLTCTTLSPHLCTLCCGVLAYSTLLRLL